MSEDYILSDDILLDAGSANPLAAVQLPGGKWTALAVEANAGLVHVIPDQKSQSGWDLLPVRNGGQAKEVVAGLDGTGVSHAFYQDGTQTYHASLDTDGNWSVPDILSLSTSLGVAIVPLTYDVVGFGITVDGNLLFIRKVWSTGDWQGTVCDMSKALVGAQCVLTMIDNNNNWTLAAVVDGELQYFSGNDTTVGSGPYTVPTTNQVTRIHFSYQRSGSTMVMFSDDKNTLYTSFGFSDQVAIIPNSPVAQGAGIVDFDGKVHFYGADGAGKLWVLHQKDWVNDAPVWAPMFPLDVNVSSVASPQSALDGAVLFAVGQDQTLHALSQNPTTKRWTRTLVQRPRHDQPYRLTRYRTQLTVLGASGNPARDVPITITATEETAILVQGETYFIGPATGQSATIKSDASGLVTFTRPATSLVSPSYTVTSPQLAQPVTVRPDQIYHDFLTAKGPINTGSAVIPPMSKDTLLSGKVGGQPLAPKLKSDLADTASKGIIHAMQSVPGKSAALRAAGCMGWALSARDPNNPRFVQFTSHEELQAYLVGSRGDSRVGGIFDDIWEFFGDVWHAIESAAIAVMDWVVSVAESLVHLVIKIGEEIAHLAAMVIHTIEDAIPFIHSIFNLIGALVEKVLDWVKDLFGWNEIWNTKRVIEHLVTASLPALQWAIEKRAIVETGTYFTDLKASVNEGFQKAITHFGSSSFSQIATPPNARRAVRGGRHGLVAAGLPAGSPAQNNWLISKVRDNVGGSGALNPLTSTLAPDIGDLLLQALGDANVISDLKNALADLMDFFETLFTDPKDFASRGVADLIKAAEALVDFVFDLLDNIVIKVLNLIDKALGAAEDILTQSLGDIPIVSWLYTNVICPSDQQEEPSILRIACLVLAVPVTLLYKLANNMKQPFDDATTQRLLGLHFTAPTADSTGAIRPNTLSLPDAKTLAYAYAFFSPVQACADMFSDGMALEPSPPPDPMTQVADWLDLIANFISQVVTWPEALFDFGWDWKDMSRGQALIRSNWIAGWWQIVVNFVMLVSPKPEEGKALNTIEKAGQVFLIVYGMSTLGVGVAGAALALDDPPPNNTNGFDVAVAVLSPLPFLCTFLLFDEVVEESEGLSIVVLLVIDALCDVASGVLGIEG